MPEFIDPSLKILDERQFAAVNISIDEKSLSPGVLLVKLGEETGEGLKVLGDVDFVLPELNT